MLIFYIWIIHCVGFSITWYKIVNWFYFATVLPK